MKRRSKFSQVIECQCESARERVTQRYWRASKRLLLENLDDSVAISNLNTISQFDGADVQALARAATNSLSARAYLLKILPREKGVEIDQERQNILA